MADELHLALLGNVEIRRDGVAVTGFRSSKIQALLCYLAVTGRPQTRPVLAGLLWGDMPEDRARVNLRRALTDLRRLVGPHLDITRQAAAFNRDSAHWLDVEVFEDQIGDASAGTNVEGLRGAVDLYRGDFLEGFYVRQALAFEEWALAEQARLRNLALGALHRLAVHYAEQGPSGLPDGINYASRLLALEPWREETHRQLMLLLACSGQRGAALAQYETCRRVLTEELGVEPGAETAALAQAIEEDRIQPDASQIGSGAATEIRPLIKPTPRPRFRTSLVGRAAEMETLRRVWARVVGAEGQVVLVEGEPGIGKTRLVEELLAEVDEGTTVLRTKCPDLQDPLAYTLFVDPLRQALSAGRPPGLTDTWLAEVSRLLPELRDRYPDLPQPSQLEPAAERRRLFDAVCTSLLALANGRPLVLFTDDLQWADATSLELLSHLIGWIGETPVLIVGAYRPHEVGTEHSLQRSRQDWQRTGLLTDLSLDTLSEPAVARLLQELTTWTGQDPSFGKLIYRETAGNPLFVIETVANLREAGRLPQSAEGWSRDFLAETPTISPGVQAIIEARLDRLDELSRQVLTAGAVMRGSFAAETAQEVSGRSELEILDSLEHLLESGLLIESGEGRFTFSHDKIREVAYGGLSLLRRKLLHRRVAETLERRYQGREAPVTERLAYHFEGAGLPDKALDYHLQAARAARQQYAHEAAIGHYQKALAYLKEGGDYGRAARALMQLGLTYHNAFDFQEARQAYQEGFALWRRAGETLHESTDLPLAPHPLRMHWGDPMTLDPTKAFDIRSGGVIRHLFSGLVELSPELDIVPDVAQSWEVLEGGRKYIFHLRDDVRWSDGAPVTAEDFECAWKRVLDPATGSPLANLLYDIKGAKAFHRKEAGREDLGVRALDEITLVVELERPTGYFLQLMAYTVAFPVPRHLVEAQGEVWTQPGNVVSNGPFRLGTWQQGGSMVLVRNRQYHGQFRGNLERVELFFRSESTSALVEMLERYEADDLDVLDLRYFPLPGSDRARQRHAGEYVTTPFLHTTYVGFDTSRPPFDDVRVRRAFALSADKETLAAVNLRGSEFAATGGFVPAGMPGHSAGIALPYDPDQARQLLAEAGYPGGRGFPLLDSLAPPNTKPHTEYLQAQWQENLGVDIALETTESVVYFGGLMNKEPPHVYLASWVADYSDPSTFLRLFSFRRWSGWLNQAYEGLVEEARSALDQSRGMKLYGRADRILIEEAAIVPLTYGRVQLLLKPWVSRYPISPIQYWFWKDVIIEPH